MKTVITLVDFSEASANALSFAAQLCQKSSARLLIINIVQKLEDEENAKANLESIKSDLKITFGDDLICEPSIAQGNLIPTLKKIIAAQRPDLIVMGTKGATGLKRILIGSNTVNVIANTSVPVLVIPEVARFENFLRKGKNTVVLATDLDTLEHDEGLQVLKTIALLIVEPKVKVLSVRPRNTELHEMQRLERDYLLSVFNPEIESERITVFSNNVISGINFYLDKNESTGLLAMIARDSGQLIQKHYTREMASQTHLPLLVLHDA
jgi:nucleotide-binding universal stress UspA family protein